LQERRYRKNATDFVIYLTSLLILFYDPFKDRKKAGVIIGESRVSHEINRQTESLDHLTNFI
jgi:hypothetical protein